MDQHLPFSNLCEDCGRDVLYPLICFMVAKGLSRWLLDVRACQVLQGVHVDRHLSLTHLLFIDDFALLLWK
jgi:hypothetical protein